MLTRQKFLNVCALLLGTSLTAFANVGYAAKPKQSSVGHASKPLPVATSSKPKLKVKVPQDAMRTRGQKVKVVLRPRIIVSSAPDSKANGSSAAAAKTGALPGSALVIRNLYDSAVNTSQVASRVDGRKLGELSAIPQDKFSTVGHRLQTGQLASEFKGANSAVLAGLNKVMPGFQNRGGNGPTSLKDLAGTAANVHNPVSSSPLSNFTGGGVGRFSDDPKATKSSGSSVIKVPVGGDSPPIIKTTIPGTGTLVINTNGNRIYMLDNGRTITYDANGNRTSDITMGAATVTPAKGGKQGSKKEPAPEDGTSDSSPKFVTGAMLRGLASRFGANRTSTGEEGTTGGPIDYSKTREGRMGQVGQPVDEQSGSTGVAIDSMQIRQALRIRLRLIEPIND